MNIYTITQLLRIPGIPLDRTCDVHVAHSIACKIYVRSMPWRINPGTGVYSTAG